MSLTQLYKEVKRVNVIWTCRDAGLVEYFLHKMDLSAISQYAFLIIFYTGKRDLVLPKHLPANFFIFRTRPALESTIAGIISLIERGEDLPEEMYENQRQLANISFEKRIKVALSRILSSYTREEFFDYGVEKTEELKLMAVQQMVAGTDASQSMTNANGPAVMERRSGLSVTRRYHRRRSSDYMCAAKRRLSSTTRSGGGSAHFPTGEISLEGLDITLSAFLGGIGDYSIHDVKGLFQQVDTDGSGFIDKAELDFFLDMALAVDEDKDVIDKVEKGMGRSSSVHNLSTNSLVSLNKTPSSNEAQEQVELIFGGRQAVEHLRELSSEPDLPLKDWSIFYCGGSSRIESELKATKKKYGIGDLAVERFNW
eukprot:CAMPEP_0181047182 /NCGR_PEP_ID=MMETSP1070-20121207/14741_1 /TAXON_ID=265543 /ORGANISM="Minutocellus polymorphus, Strain NH13" /LENGTH=368 /DNA_ID=CAMNT_0023125833 /DNA_START=57 /DNA_END=1163 /DNA_ORIENTATION=+